MAKLISQQITITIKKGVKFIRQLQEKGLIDKEALNMIGIVTLLKVMIRNLVFTLHGIRIMLLK